MDEINIGQLVEHARDILPEQNTDPGLFLSQQIDASYSQLDKSNESNKVLDTRDQEVNYLFNTIVDTIEETDISDLPQGRFDQQWQDSRNATNQDTEPEPTISNTEPEPTISHIEPKPAIEPPT